MRQREVYGLIPARGGSKGVPRKNLRLLGGRPLIAFSIAAAKLCRTITRVIVSTDCPQIAAVARDYGAEVPFLRPAELARDHSPDLEFVSHALDWFRRREGVEPELLVHLRPTTPLRDPGLIDRAVESIRCRDDATSLRSAHLLPEPPQKMMGIENGFLTGLFPHDPRPDYYNLPRQAFPPAYHPNGYVDVLRGRYIREHDRLHGPHILGFVTPFAAELDSPEDFEYLEYVIERRGHPFEQCFEGASARCEAAPEPQTVAG